MEMKIALHIRVSTEDQAKEGYSLEVQREYLESFAKCQSRGNRAEIALILDCLLRSETLKKSRWTTVTGANFPSFDKISKVELDKLKNRLKTNQKKLFLPS